MEVRPVSLPYSPDNTLEWLEEYLTINYFKKPYDRFMWWRNYTPRTKPLNNRKPLRERITNGDFDTSSFKYEAQVSEHKLNRMFVEAKGDMGVYSHNSALEINRRKRLMEDFTKDENKKLEDLYLAFRDNFGLSRELYEEEILNWDGELVEFYDYIEKKYK
jgi:hypothetical protein